MRTGDNVLEEASGMVLKWLVKGGVFFLNESKCETVSSSMEGARRR